jgi:hypothetical protein
MAYGWLEVEVVYGTLVHGVWVISPIHEDPVIEVYKGVLVHDVSGCLVQSMATYRRIMLLLRL